MAKSVTWPQPSLAWFSPPEDKTEGKKTQNQAATEGSYSKGLAKHLKGGNSALGDVSGFQTSCKHTHSSKMHGHISLYIYVYFSFLYMYISCICMNPSRETVYCHIPKSLNSLLNYSRYSGIWNTLEKEEKVLSFNDANLRWVKCWKYISIYSIYHC